jgi:hypothetical protein
VRTIDIGNEDVVVVFIRNFALRRMVEPGKRGAKEDGERERFYLCSLRCADRRKTPILDQVLQIFPSADIR